MSIMNHRLNYWSAARKLSRMITVKSAFERPSSLPTMAREGEAVNSCEKIGVLSSSGVTQHDMTKKIIFREKTYLYLGLLQMKSAKSLEAIDTLQPYAERCISMLDEAPSRRTTGIRFFAVSVLAIGQIDDFLPLANSAYTSSGWLCDSCGERAQVCRRSVSVAIAYLLLSGVLVLSGNQQENSLLRTWSCHSKYSQS